MSNPVYAKPKIQLTPEAVAGSLLIPQPAQTSMDIGRKEEMFPGLFINVSVAEIDFFDKNPRTRHDPELYRQIKESVRESGIQQPVHITRRPIFPLWKNSCNSVLVKPSRTFCRSRIRPMIRGRLQQQTTLPSSQRQHTDRLKTTKGSLKNTPLLQ